MSNTSKWRRDWSKTVPQRFPTVYLKQEAQHLLTVKRPDIDKPSEWVWYIKELGKGQSVAEGSARGYYTAVAAAGAAYRRLLGAT